MRRLDDKIALVTGGATGIGEAISKKFVLEGARVIVAGLPTDPVDEVVAEIRAGGGDALAFGGDLAEPEEAKRCVEEAVAHFGRLDVLVNNAGTNLVSGEHQNLDPEDMRTMTRTNVDTALFTTKYALPHLQRSHGNVLFTGSEAGTIGQPDDAIYGGTKGFLIAFAKGLAVEQAYHGVRVNVVCPGPTMTQWHDPAVSSMTEEMERDIPRAVPLGRHGTPEEIANVFAFVASDEASFVTGHCFFADGGLETSRATPGDKVPDALRRPPSGRLDLRHQMQGMANKTTKKAP